MLTPMMRQGKITVKDTEHGSYAYGYDVQDRLTSATYPTSGETFSYDKVGNRVKHNNGSLIKKTENGIITDYVYDGSNRLVQVKQGATILASYAYDPFGRRISKTVNGAYHYYLNDHLGMLLSTIVTRIFPEKNGRQSHCRYSPLIFHSRVMQAFSLPHRDNR